MSYVNNLKKAKDSIELLHKEMKMYIDTWNRKDFTLTGTEDFMDSITNITVDDSNCILFEFLNQKAILIPDINAIRGTAIIHTHIIMTNKLDYPNKILHEIKDLDIGLNANQVSFKGINLRSGEIKKNAEVYTLNYKSSFIIEYFYRLVNLLYPPTSEGMAFSFM